MNMLAVLIWACFLLLTRLFTKVYFPVTSICLVGRNHIISFWFKIYHGLNGCAPLKFICWNPISNVMAIRNWASVVCYARPPPSWMGLSILIKEVQGSLFSPLAVSGHSKATLWMKQTVNLCQTPNLLAPSNQNFQPLEIWAVNFCCL